MSGYWLNVDFPTRTCVVHVDGCRYVRGMRETFRKGVGRLKVDGGWLKFDSLEDVEEFFEREFRSRGFVLKYCSICM